MLSLFSRFHVIQFLIFVSYDNALPSHVASQRLDFLVPNLCPSYAQDSSSCFLPCIHVIMIMVYFVLQPISWINTVVVYSTNSPVKSVNSQS